LTAGLAHEVHNPLDGMLECLRYLKQDPDRSQRATKYYPMLTDGLQRIALVMKEMLTFARWGRKVSIEACRIMDVLDTSKLLSQPTIRGRVVDLQSHIPEDCICMCDPQGLSQTLLNLVLNAGEAPLNGEDPQVRIEATSDTQWVYISVEDNGPGVSEELHERIFESFFTTKPIGKGTGLGLSVSRQVIRAVGGELELSKDPGSLGGAKFVIRLPKAASCEELDG
jgi:C4-dicarboxylate-specific signal transduction histidine kinase